MTYGAILTLHIFPFIIIYYFFFLQALCVKVQNAASLLGAKILKVKSLTSIAPKTRLEPFSGGFCIPCGQGVKKRENKQHSTSNEARCCERD